MYSRSFYNEAEGAPRPPENYGGNAFTDPRENAQEESPYQAEEAAKLITKEEKKRERGNIFSLFSDILPFGGFSSRALPFSLSLSRIGTEEILLIIAAAYLLFSKSGDRECAIILFILLFVN